MMPQPPNPTPMESPSPEGPQGSLPMPGGEGIGPAALATLRETSPPPSPSVRRQMLQLFVIPALIVLAIFGGFALLGRLILGAEDSLDAQLLRLRQAPLHKDRGLAAYNLATMIPGVTDPAERRQLSASLLGALAEVRSEDDPAMAVYLLLAIGRLGQDASLAPLADRLDDPRPELRQAAVRGLIGWLQARESPAGPEGEPMAVPPLPATVQPALLRRLGDTAPEVAADAAVALGRVASRGDTAAMASLRQAMQRPDQAWREVRWNAAVALARLGDEAGGRWVADVLLNRQALSQLPAEAEGRGAQRLMSEEMQTRVMLLTLASASAMTQAEVWDRIRTLAATDANPVVRTSAMQLLGGRPTSE